MSGETLDLIVGQMESNGLCLPQSQSHSQSQILNLTYYSLKPIESSLAYFIVYFKTFKTVFTVTSWNSVLMVNYFL